MNKCSITKYKKLISVLPVEKQSTLIKKIVWQRKTYKDKNKLENKLFSNDTVELTREDVLSEKNKTLKIVKILMWGYPTGGRGNNIQNILLKLDFLKTLLCKIEGKNITSKIANNIFETFSNIKGLGMSTWSKFLYFFNVSIDSKKCQIFDIKIKDSLNHKQFLELQDKTWKQNTSDYIEYISLLDDLSKKMKVRPDQIELFLFTYNLNFRLTSN